MDLELLVKRAFGRVGLQIQRQPKRLWESDAGFTRLLGQVRGRAVVDATRLYMLYQYAVQAAPVPGEAAEVGVYKGGTARLLAKVFEPSGKTVHLFDTFAGMPETDAARDTHHRRGDFSDTSEEAVRAFLEDCPNAELHPGFFPETADPVRGLRFAFAHVDVDIYRSILDCCAFFYPRLQPGGILLFDDYGTPTCPGVQKAVDEFFAGKPERPLYLPTGQAVVARR